MLLIKILILATLTQLAHAAPPGGFWHCVTEDQYNKLWMANSPYEKVALNLAYDACKKESQAPQSCKASHSACENFINGISTKAQWHCTTLDEEANAWESNAYAFRLDAAFAAKAYCKSNSPVPETCYTNFVTCMNANPLE